MAFTFGNPAKPAFGSATNLTGFGSNFAQTPATTASTGFGGFGSNFGAATNTQPATGFGSTFGQTPSAAPAFGTTNFGTPSSSAPTGFGSTFAAPTASTAPTFGTGFGTQQAQPSMFGTAAAATTAAPSLFGTATSTPSLFSGGTGGGMFGSTAGTTQSAGLFGNTATTTTPSLFGTTSTTPLFGQQANTANPGLFGSSGTAATGFGTGLFGTNAATSTPSLFGTGFGNTSTVTGGFGMAQPTVGGFGMQAPQGSLFGKPAMPQSAGPQQIQLTKSQQVIASVYAINVFNDERDDILKKWNMLQACWGTGKGYYNTQLPPIEYDAQNPFYRFKAMGYNIIPEHDNSDGIVKLIFNKKIDEMKNQHEVLKNGLAGILGNRPNLAVEINQIRALSESQTEVKITVLEKGVTGISRKIPASDLANFFNQPVQKQQLSTVMVASIAPFVTPSKAELEEYLKNPLPGIDPQMWQAAIDDNPNPKKYIPVPINGFSNLRSRLLHQEHQTGLHQAFLDKVQKDINQLNMRHSTSVAQIMELKTKFCELQHRILRILVKQECSRKIGVSILPEEEMLRSRFETILQHLNNPKQFKGQVNEILSNIKMMFGTYKQANPTYRIDPDAQEDVREFLQMQQDGIAQLVNIVQTDLKALKIINEGMKQRSVNGHFM